MDWTLIQESEVVTLVISVGGGAFLFVNRAQVRRLPFPTALVLGYLCCAGAAFSTVAEGFFWEPVLNGIEHVFYLLSSVCVFVWLWRTSQGDSGRP